jgi:hypothetical protein
VLARPTVCQTDKECFWKGCTDADSRQGLEAGRATGRAASSLSFLHLLPLPAATLLCLET